ncbi:MAG TPA: hypothetical protein VGN42_20240 [Pirellulales bacterium]|nr:hypothetical protein [Pirellulales bacterium]
MPIYLFAMHRHRSRDYGMKARSKRVESKRVQDIVPALIRVDTLKLCLDDFAPLAKRQRRKPILLYQEPADSVAGQARGLIQNETLKFKLRGLGISSSSARSPYETGTLASAWRTNSGSAA